MLRNLLQIHKDKPNEAILKDVKSGEFVGILERFKEVVGNMHVLTTPSHQPKSSLLI